MFGKLKDKLKKAVNRFKSEVESEEKKVDEILEEPKKSNESKQEELSEAKASKQEPIKEPFTEKLLKEAEKEQLKEPEKKVTFKPEEQQETFQKEEKKSFLSKLKEKVTHKTISDEKFSKLFGEIEIALLENNVAYEVIEKIKEDLKEKLVNTPIPRAIDEVIKESMKETLNTILKDNENLIEKIKQSEKPYTILFCGINGSGKTTSIAKVANLLIKNNLKSVLAAADTFRAAAIQQLEEHANNLKLKIIKHDYGSDPAAVVFDANKHAESKHLDVVLVDTAGRMHTNKNLIEEIKKIVRVGKPNLKIFVGESITGNDCIEQAKIFDKAIGIDAVILTKSDVDEKGGTAISISYIINKPILYLGTGQEYKDLKPFNKEDIIKSIFE